jgi:hypothetical protein
MNWIVKSVEPLSDYRLALTFADGKKGFYDVKPLLDFGVFCSLKDVKMFKSVRIDNPGLSWANSVDIAPETLYSDSVKI